MEEDRMNVIPFDSLVLWDHCGNILGFACHCPSCVIRRSERHLLCLMKL